MDVPQIIMIVLIVLNLFIAADRHGKVGDKYNFLKTLFANILLGGLLWWGSFWN